MNPDTIREIRLQLQQLENKVRQLENEADALYNGGVDVSSSTELNDAQEQLQDEIEQTVSNLLAVLDNSDTINERDLPNTARRPVQSGELPEPAVNENTRGPPTWAKGNSKNKNSGNN